MSDGEAVGGGDGYTAHDDAQPEQSPGRSFIAELARMFTGIGRVLSDPTVQDAGAKFFDAMSTAADRELAPGTPRLLMLERKQEGTG